MARRARGINPADAATRRRYGLFRLPKPRQAFGISLACRPGRKAAEAPPIPLWKPFWQWDDL